MLRRSHSYILCLFVFLLPAGISSAQVEINLENCIENIDEAQTQLIDGFFDETIALLEPCSRLEGYTPAQQTRLFKLLADTYLALQSVTEARAAVERILEISPNFTPDANLDSQTFKNLVAEIKEELLKPNPMQNFNATQENGNVRLTWASPESAEELVAIRILRGLSAETLAPYDSVGTTAVGYTDTRPEPGQTYVYSIQAVSVNGFASDRTRTINVSIPEIEEDVIPLVSTNDGEVKNPKKNRTALFVGGGALLAGGIVLAATLIDNDKGGEVIPPETLPGPPPVIP